MKQRKPAKPPALKSKRLCIRPMTDAEIEVHITSLSPDDENRSAYGEMLDGCRNDPENRLWYAPWKMMLRGSAEYVGDLGFKGPPCRNAVEIGYGVSPAFEGQGYTTEAVQTLLDWAFRQNGVAFVEAETAPGNAASQRVLEKCGFVPDGEGKEGPRFVREYPITQWMPIYMLFGLSIGLSLGSASGAIAIGMSLGLACGLAIGAGMDAADKNKRKKLREERLSEKKE